MRLNYLEQLSKVYGYPYLQKDLPTSFPYQKHLPPRHGQEDASFFHTNCKVTKKRVCTCSLGPRGETNEALPSTADNGMKRIADYLGLYYDGYTPATIQNMDMTVNRGMSSR